MSDLNFGPWADTLDRKLHAEEESGSIFDAFGYPWFQGGPKVGLSGPSS